MLELNDSGMFCTYSMKSKIYRKIKITLLHWIKYVSTNKDMLQDNLTSVCFLNTKKTLLQIYFAKYDSKWSGKVATHLIN